jgi:hypothetical protein
MAGQNIVVTSMQDLPEAPTPLGDDWLFVVEDTDTPQTLKAPAKKLFDSVMLNQYIEYVVGTDIPTFQEAMEIVMASGANMAFSITLPDGDHTFDFDLNGSRYRLYPNLTIISSSNNRDACRIKFNGSFGWSNPFSVSSSVFKVKGVTVDTDTSLFISAREGAFVSFWDSYVGNLAITGAEASYVEFHGVAPNPSTVPADPQTMHNMVVMYEKSIFECNETTLQQSALYAYSGSTLLFRHAVLKGKDAASVYTTNVIRLYDMAQMLLTGPLTIIDVKDAINMVSGTATVTKADGITFTNVTNEVIGRTKNLINSYGAYYAVGDTPLDFDGHSGASTSRPSGINTGFMYFDTDLNKPIWWNGASWVDATGAVV